MQPKTKAIIAGTVLLAALVSLWFTLGLSTPKVNRAIFASLGRALAQEAAKAVHDQGQIVAVIADFHEPAGAVLRDQWQAFTGELKKHPSISLEAPELVQPGSRVSLKELLDRHAQASVIVFFVEPPEEGDLDSIVAPRTSLKIIAVGNPDIPARAHYGRYFASGTLAALILPRTASNSQPNDKPRTSREWFDPYYQVFTPQNYESLPE